MTHFAKLRQIASDESVQGRSGRFVTVRDGVYTVSSQVETTPAMIRVSIARGKGGTRSYEQRAIAAFSEINGEFVNLKED